MDRTLPTAQARFAIEDIWHVVERSLHFDNPGDLSRHLPEPGA